jgi:predicted ester cyclase
MGVEKNKHVVKEYVKNIINTGEVDAISNYLSLDYIEVHNNVKKKISIQEAKMNVKGYRVTYPDFKVIINQQIAEGDWVVSCCTVSGTHLGVWMNITPTGKKVEYSGVIVDKIVNGKIAEHGGAVNLFEAYLKIGAIKLC